VNAIEGLTRELLGKWDELSRACETDQDPERMRDFIRRRKNVQAAMATLAEYKADEQRAAAAK
jgi:hypothetical protein